MDYQEKIVIHVLASYKGIEDLTEVEVTRDYWSNILPEEDFSMKFDGDSEPMDDLTFFEKSQPFC